MGRIATARSLLRQAEKLVVLSGAGLSTDSGIPDYRSPGRPQVKSIQCECQINQAVLQVSG